MMNHILKFNKQIIQTSADLIKEFAVKLKIDKENDPEFLEHIDTVYAEFNQDIILFKKQTLQSLNKKHNIKPKKPSSGWNLYMADMSNHPELASYAQKDKMSAIAQWWRESSDETKSEYNVKAKKIGEKVNNQKKKKQLKLLMKDRGNILSSTSDGGDESN